MNRSTSRRLLASRPILDRAGRPTGDFSPAALRLDGSRFTTTPHADRVAKRRAANRVARASRKAHR